MARSIWLEAYISYRSTTHDLAVSPVNAHPVSYIRGFLALIPQLLPTERIPHSISAPHPNMPESSASLQHDLQNHTDLLLKRGEVQERL